MPVPSLEHDAKGDAELLPGDNLPPPRRGQAGRLRIGINALGYAAPGTGRWNYLINEVNHLAAEAPDHAFVLYLSAQAEDRYQSYGNLRKVIVPHGGTSPVARIAAEQTLLPYLAWRHRLDLLYCPSNFLPLWLPCPAVLTVSSTLSFTMPGEAPWLRRAFHRAWLPLSVRRARRVLVPSDHARRTLAAAAGVDVRRIEVIPHGVDLDRFHPAPDRAQQASQLAAWGITRPYILYVAALRPYKNHRALLAAFRRLRETHAPDWMLVFVGEGEPRLDTRLRAMARAWDLGERVIFTGLLPQKVLPLLYAGARVFAYPSLCEAFGNPLVEAMAAGVPIVASNRFAIPEVVGPAGIIVDPDDETAFARALWRAGQDEPCRRALVAVGLDRGRTMSWREASRRILAVCYQVVHESRGARAPGISDP